MNIRAVKQTYTALFAIAFVLVSCLVSIRHAAAAGGQLYISPASASAQYSGSVTVNVRINPSGSTDTVSITVGYDPSKLHYVSTDYSGSPFSTQLNAHTTANSVSFDATELSGTPVTTDSQVAKLTFSALSGTGATSLSLAGSNAAYGGASTNPSLAGASISFTCPAGQSWNGSQCVTPTPPPSSGGSTSGSGTGPTPSSSTTSSSATHGSSSNSGNSVGAKPVTTGSTSTVAVKPTGTPATITGKDVQYTKAVFNFVTNVATQAYIRFGLGDQLTSTTPVSSYATTHSIALNPAALTPGEQYSFVIVSTDQSGHVSQSAVQVFNTLGFKVKVAVLDSNHKPLANKKVTLHSTPMTVTTDKNGIATFENVAPGLHHVIYTVGSKNYDKSVSVQNNVITSGSKQTAGIQNFSVVYDLKQTSSSVAWVWAVIVLVFAAVVLVFLSKTGHLGFADRFRRDISLPLVNAPIVVGGNDSEPQTMAPEASSQTTKSGIEQQINAIPSPNTPQPGATVTPPPSETDDSNPEVL